MARYHFDFLRTPLKIVCLRLLMSSKLHISLIAVRRLKSFRLRKSSNDDYNMIVMQRKVNGLLYIIQN